MVISCRLHTKQVRDDTPPICGPGAEKNLKEVARVNWPRIITDGVVLSPHVDYKGMRLARALLQQVCGVF
jgi:hypothetical protein